MLDRELKAKVEKTGGILPYDDNDTGIIIGIGLRHLVTKSVEIDVNFSHTEVFDDNSNLFGLGARLYASEKISFGIGYATRDDVDALLLNIRLGI